MGVFWCCLIKAEIHSQLSQGDDYFFDKVRDDLRDNAEAMNMSGSQVDDLTEKFDEEDVNILMKYITFKEEEITFDYGESAACENLRTVAFRIPCKFDSSGYINSVK